LEALTAASFLTNAPFVEALKVILLQIDHFVALFSRLQSVWRGLDLQDDDGVLDAFSNFVQDEKDVLSEMDRTRDTLESSLVELVEKIRLVEQDNLPGGQFSSMVDSLSEMDLDSWKFSPWKARTVDRLVMKLENLTGRYESEDRDGFDDGSHDE
jgi:hypothetical protein